MLLRNLVLLIEIVNGHLKQSLLLKMRKNVKV